MSALSSADDAHRSWLPAIAVLCACSLTLPVETSAGIVNGVEVEVGSPSTNDQTLPRVAKLTGGGFAVVWRAGDTQVQFSGPGKGVVARTYAADASPLTDPFFVAEDHETTLNVSPDVVPAGDGGFLVGWVEDDAGSKRTLVREYSSDGTSAGPVTELDATAGARQFRLIEAGADGRVALWQDFHEQGSNDPEDGLDVVARRLDASGIALGTAFVVSEPRTIEVGGGVHYERGSYTVVEPARDIEAAGGASGAFAVVWHQRTDNDGYYSNGYQEVWREGYRVVVGADDVVGPEVSIQHNDTPGFPSVVCTGEERFVVAHSHENYFGYCRSCYPGDIPGFGGLDELRVRDLDAGLSSYVDLLGTTSREGRSALAAEPAPSGHFLVVWESRGDNTTRWDIRGQAFADPSSRDGRDALVNDFVTGEQVRPDITRLADGSYVVVWQSRAADELPWTVRARVFDGRIAPDCGDANGDGKHTAADALLVLQTSVGAATCHPCVCDVDLSAVLTASDAVNVLREAVKISPGLLQCYRC